MILSLIQTSPDAIRSTVESLQQIYTIVFALAIAEAFRQFVADRADPTEDRTIHWDRLFALIPCMRTTAAQLDDEEISQPDRVLSERLSNLTSARGRSSGTGSTVDGAGAINKEPAR